MTALSLDIAAKSFGAARVLEGVRFDLPPGQVAALLGPSGCGKSTLLSIAAGLDADFDGRVDTGPGRVAMVFQEPRLLPWRSLRRNVMLAIPDDPDAHDTAGALLARVGLSGAVDADPERVSLGMRRRAALARALAVRPALMLMDEPLVSLDAENAALMRALVREVLSETGAAALIATHDRREALSLAGRLIELGGAPATVRLDRLSPLDEPARADPARVERLHAAWFGA